MRTIVSWLGLLGTLALATLPAPAAAQPVGEEFQVNTYTTGLQFLHPGNAIAADASGNFVVVWESLHQDGSGYGVFGQRFDDAGAPLGVEFRVNSYTTGPQRVPVVASDTNGNFVVAWVGYDDSSDGVFGQRYDSGGEPQGGEFRVNSYRLSNQRFPSIASDASGNFVVVWESSGQDGSSYGVFGQRYDSLGGALGSEFQINSFTTGYQQRPSVTSDASGNFVVVWSSLGQDGNSFGIFGQRYDSGGVAQGAEFQINSYTMGNQSAPSVASDASGNFVVAWTSHHQDGSSYGIFGQRYDSGGVAQGAEFRINSYTTSGQITPSVASEASGNFVVAWQSYYQDGSGRGVFGQRYDGGGVAQGNEFQINSFTTGHQRWPSVAITGTSQFVVTWTSSGQDGSSYGVFGQRSTSRATRLPSLAPTPT